MRFISPQNYFAIKGIYRLITANNLNTAQVKGQAQSRERELQISTKVLLKKGLSAIQLQIDLVEVQRLLLKI